MTLYIKNPAFGELTKEPYRGNFPFRVPDGYLKEFAKCVYEDDLVRFLLIGYGDFEKRVYNDYPINLLRKNKGGINEILEIVVPHAAKKRPDFPKEKWESILTRLKNGEKSMLTKDNLLPELREKYERKVRSKYNEKSYSVEEFAYREALKYSVAEMMKSDPDSYYLPAHMIEKVRNLKPPRIKKPTLWERWGAAKPVSVEAAQDIEPSSIESPVQAEFPVEAGLPDAAQPLLQGQANPVQPPKRSWFSGWGATPAAQPNSGKTQTRKGWFSGGTKKGGKSRKGKGTRKGRKGKGTRRR